MKVGVLSWFLISSLRCFAYTHILMVMRQCIFFYSRREMNYNVIIGKYVEVGMLLSHYDFFVSMEIMVLCCFCLCGLLGFVFSAFCS